MKSLKIYACGNYLNIYNKKRRQLSLRLNIRKLEMLSNVVYFFLANKEIDADRGIWTAIRSVRLLFVPAKSTVIESFITNRVVLSEFRVQLEWKRV